MNKRPIILVANSSWYLYHYRSTFIDALLRDGFKVICIAPIDKFSTYIEEQCILIPWRSPKRSTLSPFSNIKAFVRLVFLIRACKPLMVHSHTMKAALPSSIASVLIDCPHVISVTGLGVIRSNSRFKEFIGRLILRCIFLIGVVGRQGRLSFSKRVNRTFFIFQNKIDARYITRILPQSSTAMRLNHRIISGSGVPMKLFASYKNYDHTKKEKPLCIVYAGRLLHSKGIQLFLDLDVYLKNRRNCTNSVPIHSIVYGSLDRQSSDSLAKSVIEEWITRGQGTTSWKWEMDPLLEAKKHYNPILIVPTSYAEGFPRGIAEAMALGIPVITCWRYAKHTFPVGAVKISPPNLKSLFKKIILIEQEIINGSLSHRLLMNHEIAKQNLSSDTIYLQTYDFYHHILSLQNERLYGHLGKRDEALRAHDL